LADSAQAHIDSGMAHLAAGRWAEGIEGLRAGLALRPDFAEVWSNLAFALREMKRVDEARDAARRAVALKPGLADGWNLLGLVEHDARRFDEARAHFGRAIELRPALAPAWMNRANAAQALGDLDAAAADYERALAIDPRHAPIHYNLGHLHHKATGNLDEAIGRYREAIRLAPAYATAHHNLAHALFLKGEFEAAWREHSWRPARGAHPGSHADRTHEPPSREALAKSHLAIVGEQGLGDVLFFLRYAPILRARGARLDFIGDPRLHGMLARTALFGDFAASSDSRAHNVIEVLAGDLPYLAPEAQSAASVPAPLPLSAEPARAAAMRERLRALGPAPHIAIAWRSGEPAPALSESLFKEAPLEGFGAALRNLPGTLVSVQRTPGPAETAGIATHARRPIHDLSATNGDLEDALALMSVVDDYVGVSSTNVHLRASAGRGARVLVPFPHEWRWMREGQSPWFPGATVLRQSVAGSWSDAFSWIMQGDAFSPFMQDDAFSKVMHEVRAPRD
jgi:Flp pilus assembly protein TadD